MLKLQYYDVCMKSKINIQVYRSFEPKSLKITKNNDMKKLLILKTDRNSIQNYIQD